jgi:hypothetical protein
MKQSCARAGLLGFLFSGAFEAERNAVVKQCDDDGFAAAYRGDS